MAGIKWTDKEIDILRALASKGYSVQDMLKVFKERTYHSIQHKAREMEIKIGFGARTAEFDEQLFEEMMRDGSSRNKNNQV